MALIDDLILGELFGNGGLNLYFPSTKISEIIHVCQTKNTTNLSFSEIFRPHVLCPTDYAVIMKQPE